MGFLLETNRYNWGYDSNGKWVREEAKLGLQITESFRKGLKFIKARISFNCCVCDTKKPKNTRYLGCQWEKVCVDCVMEWIDGSEDTINEIKQMLYERKEELSVNKDKWKKEQILGAIEEQANDKY